MWLAGHSSFLLNFVYSVFHSQHSQAFVQSELSMAYRFTLLFKLLFNLHCKVEMIVNIFFFFYSCSLKHIVSATSLKCQQSNLHLIKCSQTKSNKLSPVGLLATRKGAFEREFQIPGNIERKPEVSTFSALRSTQSVPFT